MSTVKFLDRNYLYTRLELADKNQLLRDDDRLSLGITEHHPSFRIGAYTFGALAISGTPRRLRLRLAVMLPFIPSRQS